MRLDSDMPDNRGSIQSLPNVIKRGGRTVKSVTMSVQSEPEVREPPILSPHQMLKRFKRTRDGVYNQIDFQAGDWTAIFELQE